MCSHYIVKRMENYQGDLTDIIRATAATPPAETTTSTATVAQWQFPTNPVDYPTCPVDDFGDPFTPLGDPMIHAADPTLPTGFFHHSDMIKGGADQSGGFVGNSNLDDEMKRPPNIFSRMLQISPTAKIPVSPCGSPAAAVGERGVKGGGRPPILVPNDHHRTLISPSNSKGCLVESSLQISSPRNTGIRRRKSQAKKVVCIPAPAPAGSRPSGEVVPSDLWAWRKYGQKPIKGSPYPRGYYRCSSSKGCSARKQVERSRTDPNMLVITYTSEHNHPWPTQRNALAGSTRSQPSKTAAKTSPPKSTNPNEPTTDNAAPSSAAVKEEVDQEFDNHRFEPPSDDEGFPYKPILPESNPSGEESFFADLSEIEADSLDLLFTQGFDGRDSKGLDPFGFYDWGGSGSGGPTASNGAAAASHGESERGT